MPSEVESVCEACGRRDTVMTADYHAGVNWRALRRPRVGDPRPASLCSWYCPHCYLSVTLPRTTTAHDRSGWRRYFASHEQRIPFVAALMWVLDALPDGTEPPPVATGHLECPKCTRMMERESHTQNDYVCGACGERMVRLTRLIAMCRVPGWPPSV